VLPRAAAARGKISAILKNVSSATSVLVRDVGQANFISLRDDQGRAILHYDVGFPISFNRHTFPRAFNIDTGETPPIILSHWDWDHLHAALCLPHLLDCSWIVPNQHLGPSAARLAQILAGKGNLLVRPRSAGGRFGFGELMQSQGLAWDLNNTGLTVLVALTSGRSVLLTGDADYTHLHSKPNCVDHLVATHHGARFDAAVAMVPAPRNSNCSLVISYGTRNVYGHPHPEALHKHSVAGWKSVMTTAGRKSISGRGDCMMT
jgi:competence protein ComEC